MIQFLRNVMIELRINIPINYLVMQMSLMSRCRLARNLMNLIVIPFLPISSNLFYFTSVIIIKV